MADLGKDKTGKDCDQSRSNMTKRALQLSSPKQRQGGYFEQQACLFLQAKGLTLIAQNWQQPKVGELDLVMLEAGVAWPVLVFVEVRQRKRSGFGDAATSVTQAKQKKIIKAAKCFLQQYPKYADYDCRFDVLAYNGSTLNPALSDNKESRNTDPSPEWLVGAFVAAAW